MSSEALPSLSNAANAKLAEELRQGMARVKAEGETRQREIKMQKAAEAERRLAEAERQLEEYQKMALLLRAVGDRKGLRELMRQADQLGKRVAGDLKLIGDGALAFSETDPAGALKNLDVARRHATVIAGQLRGLAALVEEDDELRKAGEARAREVDDAARNFPTQEIQRRLSEKTLEAHAKPQAPASPSVEKTTLPLLV
ncbi:MAG: hypothetical protein OEL53_06430 [Rhodospirillales bacterium]|nr:hypothetical protein [Rhodospirillales bacterium]